MSIKVSSWVWHGDETAELAGNEMILMLALADVADDNGRCRFLADDEDLSYRRLVRKARVSKSTLIRLIAKLRDSGLLEQESKGTKGKPNEFRILVPWAAESGVNLTPKSVDSVSPEPAFGLIADDHSSIERKTVSGASDAFDAFYFAYPRKVGKEAARRAFERAVRRTEAAVILAGARRYAADPNLPEKKYIPHPASWLNAGRWDDEAEVARDGSERPAIAAEDEWMFR